jgi:hypothetical protein
MLGGSRVRRTLVTLTFYHEHQRMGKSRQRFAIDLYVIVRCLRKEFTRLLFANTCRQAFRFGHCSDDGFVVTQSA